MIAFEKDYRAYRDVISAGIQALRPETEVATVELEDLKEKLARFHPHLVVCGSPGHKEQSNWDIPWIELSMDPTGQTKVYIDGDVSEYTNPTLDAMLVVIDGLEGRAQITPKSRFDESTA